MPQPSPANEMRQSIESLAQSAKNKGTGLPNSIEQITAEALKVSHANRLQELKNAPRATRAMQQLQQDLTPSSNGNSVIGPKTKEEAQEAALREVVLEGKVTSENTTLLNGYCKNLYDSHLPHANEKEKQKYSNHLYKQLIRIGLLKARANFEEALKENPDSLLINPANPADPANDQIKTLLDSAKKNIPIIHASDTSAEKEAKRMETQHILLTKQQIFSTLIENTDEKVKKIGGHIDSATKTEQERLQSKLFDPKTATRQKNLIKKANIDRAFFSGDPNRKQGDPHHNPVIPYFEHKLALLANTKGNLNNSNSKKRAELLKKLGDNEKGAEILKTLENYQRWETYRSNYGETNEYTAALNEVTKIKADPLYTQNKTEIDEYLALNEVNALSEEWASTLHTKELLSQPDADLQEPLSTLHKNLNTIQTELHDIGERKEILTTKVMDDYSKRLKHAQTAYVEGVRNSLSPEAQLIFDDAYEPIKKLSKPSLSWRKLSHEPPQVTERVPELKKEDFPAVYQNYVDTRLLPQLNEYIRSLNQSLEDNKAYALSASEEVLKQNEKKIKENKENIDLMAQEIFTLAQRMPYLKFHPEFAELQHIITRLNNDTPIPESFPIYEQAVLADPTEHKIIFSSPEEVLHFKTKDGLTVPTKLSNSEVLNELSAFLKEEILDKIETGGQVKIGSYTLKNKEEANQFITQITNNITLNKKNSLTIEFDASKTNKIKRALGNLTPVKDITDFKGLKGKSGAEKAKAIAGKLILGQDITKTPSNKDYHAAGAQFKKAFLKRLQKLAENKHENSAQIRSSNSPCQLNTDIEEDNSNNAGGIGVVPVAPSNPGGAPPSP